MFSSINNCIYNTQTFNLQWMHLYSGKDFDIAVEFILIDYSVIYFYLSFLFSFYLNYYLMILFKLVFVLNRDLECSRPLEKKPFSGKNISTSKLKLFVSQYITLRVSL